MDDSPAKSASARAKYEPAVLAHARNFTGQVSATAVAKWKNLSASAPFTELSAKAQEVSAQYDAQTRAAASEMCNDVNSALKAAGLDNSLSNEIHHASQTVGEAISGSLSQAVVRSILTSDPQSREKLLLLLKIGLPDDPASRYSAGVKAGLISQQGTLTAPPPLSDGYQAFNTWLTDTGLLADLVGILDDTAFKAVRKCMTYLP